MIIDDIAARFDRDRDRILDQWKALLSFPSISTEPAHHQDCLDCADWLCAHLNEIDFESRLLETHSKPVVYAEFKGDPDQATVLFYGHYDVQPVDPIEAWETPPFSPTEVDGRIRARGAEDNKGQHFYAIKAMESLVREKRLNRTVKVMLEGEEESGSAGITASLAEWEALIQADVLMVTDVSMKAPMKPAITLGLRGILNVTIELSGPDTDLHSGMHGGVAPNPATELARLIATLHDEKGAIAVAGFYDAVLPPTQKEAALLSAVAFDPANYESLTGVQALGGEEGLQPLLRAGFRPSLDVNGIHSGFDGPGVKMIIPALARAKITARIAAGQDPEASLDSIVRHLEAHAPAGLKLEITEKGAAGAGFRLDPESPLVKTSEKILRDICGHDAALTWEGASIPVIADLARVSGAEPLLIGFGLEQDRIHAPNESFSIEQFKLGYMYVYTMLCAL